ncbi:MAG: hypothetical protein FJ279_09905 [Planctomycetes bacterium]|nr:hypothetical protein [Planctomycetota bacterium]
MSETRAKGGWRGDAAAIAGIAAVLAVFCAPYFIHPFNTSSNGDWQELASHHAFARKCVLEFHQFPFRSPYFGGGYPVVANPALPYLSPLLLVTLGLGEVIGLKVIASLAYFVAALGLYRLTRTHYGYTRPAAAFSALALGLSSWFSTRIWGGSLNELHYCLFPWLAYCVLRIAYRGVAQSQIPNPKSKIVPLALLLAFILLDGKLAWFAIALFLALEALLASLGQASRAEAPQSKIQNPKSKIAWSLLCALGLACLLAAPRILSTAEFLLGDETPRAIFRAGYYSPKTISAYQPGPLAQALVNPWLLGVDRPHNVHVGALVLAFALAACVVCRRTHWRHIALLALAIWLSLAHYAPLDLFRLLWAVPPFHAMNSTKYFDFFIVYYLCLLPGGFMDWLGARLKGVAGQAIVALAFLLGLLPLFIAGVRVNGKAYDVPAPAFDPAEQFHQVKGLGLERACDRQPNANQYLNMLRGVGTIDFYSSLLIGEHATPRYFVDLGNVLVPYLSYRGEAWLAAGEGRVRLARLSPNLIRAEVELRSPARLAVNQNFHRAWRVDKGTLMADNGRLAVALAETGSYTLTLRYRPATVLTGMAVSCLALIGLALAAVYKAKAAGGRAFWC